MKKKIIGMCLLTMLLSGCGSETETIVDTIEPQVIDVDVAAMSDVMAYSTLENIMYNPTEYLGKVVRVQGSFYYEYYQELDMKFFAILLMDETDCCMAFAEVEIQDGVEYPQVGQECMLIGEVKTKIIDGQEYAYLDVSERVY